MYKGLTTKLSAVVFHEDGAEIIYRGSDLGDLMRDGNFVSTSIRQWTGRWPEPSELKVIEAILTAALDHGYIAAAPARMVIDRSPESFQGAIATGLLACGSRKGGAGEAVARMLQEAGSAELDPHALAEKLVTEHFEKKRNVPGLGNPVHEHFDPRAKFVLERADELGISGRYISTMRLMQALTSERLGRDLVINFSGSVGATISDLGWNWRLGNALILLGRCAGVIANVVEELLQPTDSFWRDEISLNSALIYDGER